MKCYICGNDAPELFPSLVPDHWECERCLKRRLEYARCWSLFRNATLQRYAEIEEQVRQRWPTAGVYAYAAPFPPWEEP
jgi:hypothetical protein